MINWSKIIEGKELISASKQRITTAEQKNIDTWSGATPLMKGWRSIKTDKPSEVGRMYTKQLCDRFYFVMI